MKVVLLAGGFGTRISEESHLKPKPMIEIGDQPILWHIMKTYSHYGFHDFVICCGYKANVIKEYFASYYLRSSAEVTYDFTQGDGVTIHNHAAEPWRVTLADTGLNTMTGGRLGRVQKYIGDEPFMLTYGDGVCNVDIARLLDFHKSHGRQGTITAVQPGSRFGVLEMGPGGAVKSFAEKKREDGGWINGGYMVLGPKIFDYISGDDTVLEREPLEKLAQTQQLCAYCHDGFWQCMDTLRDKNMLEKLWDNGTAPWKVWKQ